RRAFLEAGLTLPAVVGLPCALHSAPELAAGHSLVTAPAQDSSFDPWVEIHRDNLRHNVSEISRRVSARPILAVIKNNGCGRTCAQRDRPPTEQPDDKARQRGQCRCRCRRGAEPAFAFWRRFCRAPARRTCKPWAGYRGQWRPRGSAGRTDRGEV